ncbi:MAG: NUDIX domain-containing protein [Gemmatimonadales bacterium]|nr:MAG: NUDIX domain-containing protein [Gemmatimonadales bacterium]
MRPIPVVAAVIRRETRVLLALRPPEKRHGGLWEFPGGKLVEGETESEAMVRELAEELGVRVMAVGALLAAYHDPDSPFEIRFRDVTVAGAPRPLEHTELCWATREEALCLPLAPTDRRFVEDVLGGRRQG